MLLRQPGHDSAPASPEEICFARGGKLLAEDGIPWLSSLSPDAQSLAPQLGRLIPEEDSLLPIFDAVNLHARAAAAWALEGGSPVGLPSSNCVLDAR